MAIAVYSTLGPNNAASAAFPMTSTKFPWMCRSTKSLQFLLANSLCIAGNCESEIVQDRCSVVGPDADVVEARIPIM